MGSSQALTDKMGHFAWCALVALKRALRDGLVSSDAQQNLFLSRWHAKKMTTATEPETAFHLYAEAEY